MSRKILTIQNEIREGFVNFTLSEEIERCFQFPLYTYFHTRVNRRYFRLENNPSE